MLKYLCYITIGLIGITSCSNNKTDNNEEESVETVLPDTPNEVTVMCLQKSDFNHELVSNGKVSAKAFANLHFETSEIIANIWVKNGDKVKKGQKLAELDKFKLKNKVSQTKDALERSKLELQDVLIGQGYSPDNISQVPEAVLKLAKVKSGYDQSMIQYEIAQHEEQNATLTAPFDGMIANLFSKQYNLPDASKAFCTLIDTRNMEAEFSILESELTMIKTGSKVLITPFSDNTKTYEGIISEINPIVDDKGMVKAKAHVNEQGRLFEGMNVKVNIRHNLGEQLVVPKEAIVLRSGKQVAFTLKNGKAQWVYVTTGQENETSYTVTDGLQEGDSIIVSGNLNLAHEAPVSVIKE